MGRPRTTRLHYRRLAAVIAALTVTSVAVLGGVGLLPVEQPVRQVAFDRGERVAPRDAPAAVPQDHPSRRASEQRRSAAETARLSRELPEDSGSGRRVVFDISAQRVWLVAADERVRRTYLVSGSRTDNLRPGAYDVYSRSARAWGIDDSGTMRFMVRFARGDRAAIGFHDIPVKDGRRLQTRAQLGTPQSHGCIRQARPDAKALWDFAPVDTRVVVVA